MANAMGNGVLPDGTATSHYLNQLNQLKQLPFGEALWHSHENNITANVNATILYNEFNVILLKLLHLPGPVNSLTRQTPWYFTKSCWPFWICYLGPCFICLRTCLETVLAKAVLKQVLDRWRYRFFISVLDRRSFFKFKFKFLFTN